MDWVQALKEVSAIERAGAASEIACVEYDSRRVGPGAAFVAMRGGTNDGNRYIDAAIAQGAAAIVTDSQEAYEKLRREHPEIAAAHVQHGRRALAELSAAVLGHPERKLAVSAVTGTNGKTTTAYLLEQMLRSVGRKCVLIGTIETHVGDEVRASEHTTPEASDVLKIFADGVAAGATEAVMEMSSHALDQERVWGIPVDVAIFTNLTQDHLDYHGTMERYAAAKARLFEGVGAQTPRVAVINADDQTGRKLIGSVDPTRVMSYGIDTGRFRAENIALVAGRRSFEWRTPTGTFSMEYSLTGRVNLYNLMAASCAALARGLSTQEVIEATRYLDEVPGRFQVVNGSFGVGFAVVVDYAHTDDALQNLIALGRDLVGRGRVITVFGCGGDRDRTKRKKMGRVAGQGSDLVFLTSDNPRSEDPSSIIEEILVGVRETAVECFVEPDRSGAIRHAISLAQPGDIVLIAGKGHEKVQIFRDHTVAFDDAELAAEALRPILRNIRARIASERGRADQ
jgi:UDP-N-acetylmuramoyl-L-alanyl-D-glutamate--2,6-diaminopimelate ligase